MSKPGTVIAAASLSPGIGTVNGFASLTAALAFLLIIAGGLVTSTGSALAVPDWPLSHGQYFPRMAGGVLFEHGHRMIAGAVGLMTLMLSSWVLFRESRRWVRGLAAAAAVGIVLQAALGGLTVLYLLPRPVSVAHACLGQTVFCILVCLAQATSPRFVRSSQVLGDAGDASVTDPRRGLRQAPHFWPVICFAVVYIQLILGAVLRHGGRSVLPHLAWAPVVVVVLAVAAGRGIREYAREPFLARPVYFLVAVLAIQIYLGFAALALRYRPALPGDFWRVVLPTAHVACGAAILAACVVWTLRACKRTQMSGHET